MISLKEAEEQFKRQKIQSEYLKSSLREKTRSLRIVNKKINDLEEVHTIWINLAKQIQRKARTHIESIVTMAIQTVYHQPFKFKMVFEEKRKNITCTPLVVIDDKEYSPKDSMGGAMLDIIGFALRITLWSMRVPRTRNTFILDEPFRFCGDLTYRTGLMIKKLSQQLNFQVLLVTHDPDLKEICDKVWSITNKKFSKTKLIK